MRPGAETLQNGTLHVYFTGDSPVPYVATAMDQEHVVSADNVPDLEQLIHGQHFSDLSTLATTSSCSHTSHPERLRILLKFYDQSFGIGESSGNRAVSVLPGLSEEQTLWFYTLYLSQVPSHLLSENGLVVKLLEAGRGLFMASRDGLDSDGGHGMQLTPFGKNAGKVFSLLRFLAPADLTEGKEVDFADQLLRVPESDFGNVVMQVRDVLDDCFSVADTIKRMDLTLWNAVHDFLERVLAIIESRDETTRRDMRTRRLRSGFNAACEKILKLRNQLGREADVICYYYGKRVFDDFSLIERSTDELKAMEENLAQRKNQQPPVKGKSNVGNANAAVIQATSVLFR
ncbi:hypothetical protein FACS189472_16030 [Alphaproteobacteria bacterium]|nr:hypothetical protein FACS189472_16030 [Alphaproteobacteria bacterium]